MASAYVTLCELRRRCIEVSIEKCKVVNGRWVYPNRLLNDLDRVAFRKHAQ
jgi:hypothetical protein